MRVMMLWLIALLGVQWTWSRNVSFDGRALIIDGERKLLISGSIHYPRSTPAMWPRTLKLMREFGANMLEMYDFWTGHEPVEGQYNFADRYDIVRFIKEAQKADLYVLLRIGPYVNAEWNYGGLPTWLKFENNITFRTYNPQFMNAMRTWVTKLVMMLKEEKLFYTQGGPIVAAQIENEYGLHEHEYGEDGKKYVKWVVDLAHSFNLNIPWIMCFQDDAPAYVINTCNGFYCDRWIEDHKRNFPNQPSWHTENWLGWFQNWGKPRPFRPVEDIAFSTLRWYSRGGTMMNYYMFHGGNSYDRTGGGPNFVTHYYFGGMLDEFGQLDNERYEHLQTLNLLLLKYANVIVAQEPQVYYLESNVEVHIYGAVGTQNCISFLANVDAVYDKTVNYNSRTYFLPAWSVSILRNCIDEEYNSAKRTATTYTYSMHDLPATSTQAIPEMGYLWEEIASAMPPEYFRSPREQILTTKDTTDYLWYSAEYKAPNPTKCTLEFSEAYDLLHVFVNQTYVGTTTSKIEVTVNATNEINILSMTQGLINFGTFFEKYKRGIIGKVTLCGTDITDSTWKHVPGLKGEVKKYFDPKVAETLPWQSYNVAAKYKPLVWFSKRLQVARKTYPLALDMHTMGKGFVWVNGHNVGRYSSIMAKGKCEPCDYRGVFYESKCFMGCNEPSQRFYHVPEDWVNIGDNLIVIFEETGGDLSGVKFVERQLDTISADVIEKDSTLSAHLSCPEDLVLEQVQVVPKDNPAGYCEFPEIKRLIETQCLHLPRCRVEMPKPSRRIQRKQQLTAKARCTFSHPAA